MIVQSVEDQEGTKTNQGDEIKNNQNQYYNQFILDELYLRNYKSQNYIT